MKKLFFLAFCFILVISTVFAQEKPKAKHLLPNGEPDRPFTFFVKHGFAFYPDAITNYPFAGRSAYFFGAGTRVEDDDKDSPLFIELEGLYHFVNGADTLNKSLNTLRINMNIYFVVLTNSAKSFRWNAGTGFGWNSINDGFIDKKCKQFGINFNTQLEMLLKHKRFNVFASYHLLPFHNSNVKQYSFNTINVGMGFYFR